MFKQIKLSSIFLSLPAHRYNVCLCSLKYRKFKSEVDLAQLGDEIDPSRRGDLSQAFDDFIVESEQQEHADMGTSTIL